MAIIIQRLFCHRVENLFLCYAEWSMSRVPDDREAINQACGKDFKHISNLMSPSAVGEHWSRRETKALEIII